jgi:hypothetical protein
VKYQGFSLHFPSAACPRENRPGSTATPSTIAAISNFRKILLRGDQRKPGAPRAASRVTGKSTDPNPAPGKLQLTRALRNATELR